jgi:hypothetical protein
MDSQNGSAWNCTIDYTATEAAPLVTDLDVAKETANNNCTKGFKSEFGVKSYSCWDVVNNGNKLKPVAQDDDTFSKTWVNEELPDKNGYGKCIHNDSCRTKDDVDEEVSCLQQTNENDYSNNWQCHQTSGENTNTTSTATDGSYRKRFVKGYWDPSYFQWVSTNNNCVVANQDCRTKNDVDANVDCMINKNWQCYSLDGTATSQNIGVTDALNANTNEEWHSQYTPVTPEEYYNDASKRGVGQCTRKDGDCRKQEDVVAEISCHNAIDNYPCWEVSDGGDVGGDTIRTFVDPRGRTSKTYNRPDKNDAYADTTNFDKNCIRNNRCLSRDEALTSAGQDCMNINNDDICYMIDGVNVDTSYRKIIRDKTIKLDKGVNAAFVNGRKKRFDKESSQCISRDVCSDGAFTNKKDLCESQTAYCFDESNVIVGKGRMVYDSSADKCALPYDCSNTPFCRYMTVRTNNKDALYQNGGGAIRGVDEFDCSANDGMSGRQYEWTLESKSKRSTFDNPVPSDIRELANTSHWRLYDNMDNKHGYCTSKNIDNNTINPKEIKDTAFKCPCVEDDYAIRFYRNEDRSDNNGEGYENVDTVPCGDDECKNITIYQKYMRKNPSKSCVDLPGRETTRTFTKQCKNKCPCAEREYSVKYFTDDENWSDNVGYASLDDVPCDDRQCDDVTVFQRNIVSPGSDCIIDPYAGENIKRECRNWCACELSDYTLKYFKHDDYSDVDGKGYTLLTDVPCEPNECDPSVRIYQKYIRKDPSKQCVDLDDKELVRESNRSIKCENNCPCPDSGYKTRFYHTPDYTGDSYETLDDWKKSISCDSKCETRTVYFKKDKVDPSDACVIPRDFDEERGNNLIVCYNASACESVCLNDTNSTTPTTRTQCIKPGTRVSYNKYEFAELSNDHATIITDVFEKLNTSTSSCKPKTCGNGTLCEWDDNDPAWNTVVSRVECSDSNLNATDAEMMATTTKARTFVNKELDGCVLNSPKQETRVFEDGYCAMNCVLSEWSEYSACPNVLCGDPGMQTRTRTKTEQKYNGDACVGELDESKGCPVLPECGSMVPTDTPVKCVVNSGATCDPETGKITGTKAHHVYNISTRDTVTEPCEIDCNCSESDYETKFFKEGSASGYDTLQELPCDTECSNFSVIEKKVRKQVSIDKDCRDIIFDSTTHYKQCSCDCPQDEYAVRYFVNENYSGTAYASEEAIKNELCGTDTCDLKTVYHKKMKLNESNACTTPDDFNEERGTKSLTCYNEIACRNVCLDENNNANQSNPTQCVEPAKSTSYNKYTFSPESGSSEDQQRTAINAVRSKNSSVCNTRSCGSGQNCPWQNNNIAWTRGGELSRTQCPVDLIATNPDAYERITYNLSRTLVSDNTGGLCVPRESQQENSTETVNGRTCPKGCTYGPWSSTYTACTTQCDAQSAIGTRSRSRPVIPQEYGGNNSCPETNQTTNCLNQPTCGARVPSSTQMCEVDETAACDTNGKRTGTATFRKYTTAGVESDSESCTIQCPVCVPILSDWVDEPVDNTQCFAKPTKQIREITRYTKNTLHCIPPTNAPTLERDIPPPASQNWILTNFSLVYDNFTKGNKLLYGGWDVYFHHGSGKMRGNRTSIRKWDLNKPAHGVYNTSADYGVVIRSDSKDIFKYKIVDIKRTFMKLTNRVRIVLINDDGVFFQSVEIDPMGVRKECYISFDGGIIFHR